MKILGISAYYHDSAVCLLENDKILLAVQEERFTRKRHDASFPNQSIQYCLDSSQLKLNQLDAIVFYDKPLLKFERILETYLSFVPKGFLSFVQSMPVWLKEKLFLKDTIKKELRKFSESKSSDLPKLLFSEHHESHAASAFYPSSFENSAVLCLDGVGEWATTSAWYGEGSSLKALWQIDFPHSIGLLYSALTYYTGFKVNSGEYKVMGLAPYGEPVYKKLIYDHLIEVKEDGTFKLNLEYFNYIVGLKMTNSKFSKLFGGEPRRAESKLTQKEMDLARSIQEVIEEIVIKLAKSLKKETGSKNLCLAGGVALNCVANGKLVKEKIFDKVFIQPAAGDAGGALGAAYSVYHNYYKQPRNLKPNDKMEGSYLGPKFSNQDIKTFLEKIDAKYEFLEDEELFKKIAKLLSEENIFGLFQGRMEFGPRSLGARSIIGDARSKTMQSVMNLKIKFRESFRPFAPAILFEKVNDYFELNEESPYMLLVSEVNDKHKIKNNEEEKNLFGIEKLNQLRSTIPSVTHVDYSARIQTVHKETNPFFHKIISEFDKLTGCPVVVNTSFNVRGEPIVCNPEDAYRCFMRTNIDYLVLENFILSKKDQKPIPEDESWKNEFELD